MPPESEKNSPSKLDNKENIIQWLDKNYIENILKSYLNDKSIKVLLMEVSPALGKGENFGGILTRVHVDYKVAKNIRRSKESFIVKTSYEGDEFAAEKMKEYDIFNREMMIYEQILPKLINYLHTIRDYDVLFADTLHVDYKNSTIVFEDLVAKSFIMADRTEGLDMKHAKLALRKLAKFHATSAVYNERTNGSLEKFDRGMFNRYTSSYSELFEGNLLACSDMIETFSGKYLEYSDKLRKLKPHLMEHGKKVFDCDKSFFNVLAHGDFWTNNVMYKYNENKEPTDLVIIDFQYSCWGSPAIDLHYFLNTSIKKEMKLENQEELIHFYYLILVKTLSALNYNSKIPSLQEFWTQLIAKSFYAFTSTCIIQPVMLCLETEDADFHALMDEDERAKNFKKSLYQNEKVQNIVKKMIPIFDCKGLLDVS